MGTFVSMVNWCGDPQPDPDGVAGAVHARSAELAAAGLHSLVFLPDEGECAAIMIASARDAHAAERIARAILPSAEVRIETMPFDDDPGLPAWLLREADFSTLEKALGEALRAPAAA